jgi:Tol biopolymer transport system component
VVERVSVRWGNVAPNADIRGVSVSGNGRYVAFYSAADNLVSGDTNGSYDVFVYDRQFETIELISVAIDGGPTNSSSTAPSISGGGRYVAFASTADNIVESCCGTDILVRDRVAGTTRRLSFGPGGSETDLTASSPSISDNGTVVAYVANATNLVAGDTNGTHDIFVHVEGADPPIRRISVASNGAEANDFSFYASVSADGTHVAFQSRADNLVPGDTNGVPDIFVHNLASGQTERVNVANDGAQANNHSFGEGNAISADGNLVVFRSAASNLVGSADTNGTNDVFIRNRAAGTTQLVSVASDGAQANAYAFTPIALSANGDHVVFSSEATNLVPGDTNGIRDLFLHTISSGTTVRIDVAADDTQADQPAGTAALSADGSVIAFASPATTLVADETNAFENLFVVDRSLEPATPEAGPQLLTVCGATEGNGRSFTGGWYSGTYLSDDGRFVVFRSAADNLLAADTNDVEDIFVYDRITGLQERVSIATDGSQANETSRYAQISGDGRYVTFTSLADNLLGVGGDSNDSWDLFLRDRTAGTTVRVIGSDTLFESPHTNSVPYAFPQYSMSDDATVFALNSARTSQIRIFDRSEGSTTFITGVDGAVPDDEETNSGRELAPVVSPSGRYISFYSFATNLVPGDTNGTLDIFVLDRDTGTIERIADQTLPGAAPGTGYKNGPMTDDDRYIALAAGSTSGWPPFLSSHYGDEIIVYDRIDKTVDAAYAPDNTLSLRSYIDARISPTGQFVAINSYNQYYIPDEFYSVGFLVLRRATEELAVVVEDGSFASFSTTGAYAGLSSRASTLVPDDTNGLRDVFVAQHNSEADIFDTDRCANLP